MSAPADRSGPFSRFEFLVAWRYLRAPRRDRFVSVIASLTLTGIALGVAALIVVTIQIAIPYVPALAEAFRATPLALNEWLVVAVVALAPAVVAEVWRTLRGTRWVA